MSDIHETPKVRCDNCGFVDEKERVPYQAKPEWRNKVGWGGLRIGATTRGTYPNDIKYVDLCPECLGAVHDAVNGALRKERGHN